MGHSSYKNCFWFNSMQTLAPPVCTSWRRFHITTLLNWKSVALKKVNQLAQYAEVFFYPDSSKENMASAGEQSIVAIYSGGKVPS